MKTGNVWEDFEWEVSIAGYHWEESPAGWLLLRNITGTNEKIRRYNPFAKEHSGLFRAFAGLAPTQQSVLAFANEYGLLGVPVLRHIWAGTPVSVPGSQDGTTSVSKLAAGMLGDVGEVLAWEPGKPTDQWCWATQIRSMSGFVKESGILRETPGLAGSLLWTANIALEKSVPPRLEWSVQRRAFQLRLRPSSLIGALWLQAALSIAEPKTFKKCPGPGCDRVIEISRTGGARTDAMFCSNRCKSREYRERVAKARRLARNKIGLPQIAKRLRTNVRTIRKWIR